MNPGKTVPTADVTATRHVYTALRRQQELLVVVAARLARDEALRRAVQAKSTVALSSEGTLNPANRAFSPTARVPCLHDGDDRRLGFARDRRIPGRAASGHVAGGRRRAGVGALDLRARCIRASRALRNEMTMCIRERVDVRPWSDGARARHRARDRDLERKRGAASARAGRIFAARSRWPTRSTRRSRFASRPTAWSPAGAAGDYLQALLAHPFLREWEAAALAETAIIEADEPRIIYRDKIAARRGAASDARDGSGARRRLRRRGSARRRRRETPLRIRGGGTKDFYGERARGRRARHARLRRHRRLRSDRARDHRARRHAARRRSKARCARAARCSRSSRRVSARVRRSAAPSPRDCPGPRRPYAGAVRDIVLGVRMFDGTRRGPRVRRPGDEERRGLRRVAADDRRARHARRASPKSRSSACRCRKAEATRVFECAADEAIRLRQRMGRQPLPLSATCYHAGRLAVRLSGAAPAVRRRDAQTRRRRRCRRRRVLGGRARSHASRSSSRRARRARRCGGCRSRSTAPYADLGGEQLIEWGGALRWLAASERTDPARVRAWAAATRRPCDAVSRAPTRRAGAFHPLAATLLALHRRLKAVFDPARHPQSRPAVSG